MPVNVNRRPVLLGATIATTLLLLVGAAVVLSRLGHGDAAAVSTVASSRDIAAEVTPRVSAVPPPPELAAAATEPAPAAAAADSDTSDDTAASASDTAADVAAADPPAPAAPAAAASIAPGQRLNPSSAQVQAAITTLHQRIPLFSPTDQQLRTFADAVCTSFDNGMSQAEVQSTVQQAVSHIQGKSLSAPDAAFAVGIVTELRCPGYL